MPPDLILPPKPIDAAPIDPVNCTSCKFYRMTNLLSPKMGGGCHFDPPGVVLVGQQQDKLGRVLPVTMSFWPAVGETDFCSHWAPNKDKADA